MSKFIVIDGVDGVGKTTQVNLLKEKYPAFHYYKFPMYDSHPGCLIKAYLNGCFENNPLFTGLSELERVKKISLLYTLDRAYFFNVNFKDDDSIYIFDRYTTSNIILQTAYLNNTYEIDSYIDWLEDTEYNKFKIPKPDTVIFLDLPSEVSYYNLTNRSNPDILETLDRANRIGERKRHIIEKCGWEHINCYDEIHKKMKTPEDIHETIIKKIQALL